MNTPVSRRSFLRGTLRTTAAIVLAQQGGYASVFNGGARGVEIVRACHVMGSTLRITALADSKKHGISAISAAFAEMDRLDRMLSIYRGDSAVSRINTNAGCAAITVDDEVLSVIEHGVAFSRELQGAFDITLEPLMRAWGFRQEWGRDHAPPSDKELSRMLEAVGPDMIDFDMRDRAVGLRKPGSAIDLGGIGVGFALDRAVHVLRKHGIEHAFINHSGDAYALGRPPEADGWAVGIPDPRHPERLYLSLELSNQAVSTSGSYENYIRRGDRFYGHILNPRNGHPAETHLGVTVIAGSSLEADVLSTSAFCSEPSGTVDASADIRRAEIIRLDRSQAGDIVCSQHSPIGMPPTPVQMPEEG